jgi:glutaminyl-peptide cyclotransferase
MVQGMIQFNLNFYAPNLISSRHLAEKWSTTFIAPHSKRRFIRPSGLTEIDTIEHLILLDLLGAANPRTRSFFLDTAWLYDGLISAERRLAESGAFVDGNGKSTWSSFFAPRTRQDSNAGYIGDDHLPFLQRGVSVLHIIAEPFPRVWHTLGVRIYTSFAGIILI